MDEQHGAAAHHSDHRHGEPAELAELLDLDAEVLHSYWTEVLSWVQLAATGMDCRRILDLGAGTGTGAIALAQRFGAAEVIAVDSDAEMLRRIDAKALEQGLSARVRTVEADLDNGWPAIGPIDLSWASMSLHHLADPDRTLADLYANTRPGGLVAVIEFSEQLRFLPDDLGIGRPGLEARCLEALSAEHAHALPELGSDWSARLAAAGFVLAGERTFSTALDRPLPPATVAYASGWLRRQRDRLAAQLAADDLQTLAILLDGDGPESLQRRGDLRVRGSRTGTLARRAG
ncbi:MAG: class I SAM-dependent methyltransferase [Jatrophihabitantaceae bacterium]